MQIDRSHEKSKSCHSQLQLILSIQKTIQKILIQSHQTLQQVSSREHVTSNKSQGLEMSSNHPWIHASPKEDEADEHSR